MIPAASPVEVGESNEPRPVTPGRYDTASSYVYKNGQCLTLAAAMHERTGWPIAVISDGHRLVRAYVRDPDGMLVDIDGAHTVEAELEEHHAERVAGYGMSAAELDELGIVAAPSASLRMYDSVEATVKAVGVQLDPQDLEAARCFARELLQWWAGQGQSAVRRPELAVDLDEARLAGDEILAAGDPAAALAEYFVRAGLGAAERVASELTRDELRSVALRLVQSVASTRTEGGEVSDMSPDAICEMSVASAATAFGTTPERILSADRHRTVTDARAVAMTAVRRGGMTLPAIATYFGKDHTTVLYALKKVEGNPRLSGVCSQIVRRIDDDFQPTRVSVATTSPAQKAPAVSADSVTLGDRRSPTLQLGGRDLHRDSDRTGSFSPTPIRTCSRDR